MFSRDSRFFSRSSILLSLAIHNWNSPIRRSSVLSNLRGSLSSHPHFLELAPLTPHVRALPTSIAIDEPVVVVVMRSVMGDTALVMVSVSTIMVSILVDAGS